MKTWGVIGVLAIAIGAFVLGVGRGSMSSSVVHGKESHIDTVVVHDTLHDTISGADIKVTRRPSLMKKHLAMAALQTVDTLPGAQLLSAAPDSVDSNAVADSGTPPDSDICYSFMSDKGGRHAYVEMCSRFFPPQKPWDLHGAVDMYCGKDTVRIPARIDTTLKFMEKKEPIKKWLYAGGGAAVVIILRLLIGK